MSANQSDHHLLLFGPLLLFHFTEASGVEPLETAKYKAGVFGAADLFVDVLEAAWHTRLHRLGRAALFVMIDVEEQLLG